MSIYDRESTKIAELGSGDLTHPGMRALWEVLALLKLPNVAIIVRPVEDEEGEGISFWAIENDDE